MYSWLFYIFTKLHSNIKHYDNWQNSWTITKVCLLGSHCPLNIEHSHFSHLCLYEIGFLSMWETSISHDHCSPPFNLLVLGTILLKVGEKESIMSVHAGSGNFTHGVGISSRTQQAWSLVEIPTPRVRFPYPAWTLMMDSYILPCTCVCSVSLKPFEILLWNFSQMYSPMRQHAEHKKHNSG